MKAIAVISCIFAVVVAAQSAAAPSIKDKVAALAKKCAAESHIPGDKAKIAFNQELPTNDNERCFLECVYKGINVVVDNKFSVEGGKKLALARFQKPEEREMANQLIETCGKEVSAQQGEKCSLGKTVRECFVKHGKSVNFFPSAA